MFPNSLFQVLLWILSVLLDPSFSCPVCPCPPVLCAGLHYAYLLWDFISLVLFVPMTPGCSSPSPDSHVLGSPLYPPCTYLLNYLLQYCHWFTCLSPVRLYAPCRQEFCLIISFLGILQRNVMNNKVPISVHGIESREDNDFLQRFFKDFL